VRDHYAFWVQLLVATAILGLGARYGSLYVFHLVLGYLLVRSACLTGAGTLLDRSRLASSHHAVFSFTLLWFALAMLWSWDRSLAAQYWAYLAIGSALAVLVIKYVQGNLERFEQLWRVAVWMFTLDIALGVLEAAGVFRLPTSPYSPHSAHWGTIQHMSDGALKYLAHTPTGFHWNPNNFATVMNLVLPFVLLHARMSIRVVGGGVIAYLVFMTGSRGGLATTALILLAAPLFCRRVGWFVSLAAGAAVTGTLVLGGFFANYEQIENPRLRDAAGTLDAIRLYVSSQEADAASIRARRELIRNGLAALQSTWGLGLGGGGDQAAQQLLGQDVGRLRNMHHFWIELLVNGGVVFFAVFALWYLRVTAELWQFMRRFPRGSKHAYYCGGMSLALCGFIPGAIPCSSTIYMLPMYLLFGFAVALVNHCRQLAQDVAAQCGPPADGRPQDRRQHGAAAAKPARRAA